MILISVLGYVLIRRLKRSQPPALSEPEPQAITRIVTRMPPSPPNERRSRSLDNILDETDNDGYLNTFNMGPIRLDHISQQLSNLRPTRAMSETMLSQLPATPSHLPLGPPGFPPPLPPVPPLRLAPRFPRTLPPLHLHQPLPPVPEATEPETTECLSRVSSESATSTDWSNDSDPDDDYVEMKSISKF